MREFGLVGRITCREFGYEPERDGHPLAVDLPCVAAPEWFEPCAGNRLI